MDFLGVYSPDNVNLIVVDRKIKGFADGEFIRTERAKEDEYTAKVGAKGDFTFVKQTDKSGHIVFTLKQNAEDNKYLQALKEAQTVFPVRIVSNGAYRELAASVFSMIGVAPRKAFDVDEGPREWRIVCGELLETDK